MKLPSTSQVAKLLNRRMLAGWLYLGINSIGAAVAVAAAARYLPVEQAGIWFTLQSIAAIAMLGDLGLSVTGVRQMAHSYAAPADGGGRWVRVEGMIETRTGLAGISDVSATLTHLRRYTFPLSMAIGGAIGLAFFSRQSLEATPHIEVALAWALMTGTTLIQIDGVRHQATLEGVGRIDVERLVLAAAYVLTFGCLIGVTIFTKSIVAMSMTWMVGTLVGRACLRMAVKRLLGRLPPPLPSADQRGVAMLGISFRVWLVSLGAAAAVHSQALSVGLFLGAAALPGYYLAHKMLEALTSSLAVVVQADRALLTQELAAGRFSSAYARVKRSTSIVATGAVVVTLCFSIWGKWIVTTWLRNPGAIDDVTVHLLALNAGFSIFTGLVGQLVLATGRNPFVPSVLAAGAINVTLLLVLVPALGIRGAALASLISGLMSSYPYNIYQGLKTLRAIRVGSR